MKNLVSKYSSFKKVKDFPGSFSKIIRSPFSNDNKQIVTLLEGQICIWHMESGELQKKFDTNFKEVLGITPDLENLVFCEKENIQMYSTKTRFVDASFRQTKIFL